MEPYLWCYSRKEVLQNGWFGTGPVHPMLAERIGDYVLIMKKNYILKDTLVGEAEKVNIGEHGGVSHEEMLVPLITVEL